MSFRDGLPFDEAVKRQERLNRAVERHAQANQERVVRTVITQIEKGADNPATRVLTNWLATQVQATA